MKDFIKNYKIILLIIIIAIFFRLYGLNWDQGFHLHPDERAITMFSLPLQFPKTIPEFLSPQSPWNPHFFAYGSFPLYLLRILGNLLSNFDPSFGQYDKINLVGRAISTFFDIGILFVVFLLGKKLFNKTVGQLGAFFYGISVLPIQLSHFYAVDTLLTFFIFLTLYLLILFYEKPTLKKAVLIGISFGFALSTKISATVLLSSIGVTLIIDFLLIFLKNPHHPKIWFSHLPKLIKKLFVEGAVIVFITSMTFIILEPYALIDFKEFWWQTLQQRQMTYDAFTFPYTLQYVGKTPYLYELKNIFLWGQGPILALVSFSGILCVTFSVIGKHLGRWRGNDLDSSEVNKRWSQKLIILAFFWVYFLVVGNFAIGFMRYMLPLYPLLSLFGAIFVFQFYNLINNLSFSKFQISSFKFQIKSQFLNFKNLNIENSLKIKHFKLKIIILVFIASILMWPLAFINIYSKPNTRVIASQWIYKNIPYNAFIAREHWDDGLPIGGTVFYKTIELPIYDMQNPFIKKQIYQIINGIDYIIIASNRLHTPLQRIATNCKEWNLPEEKCTHNASDYYKQLFNGSLGFKKIAEFSSYPKLEIGNWKLEIRDEIADESFTVYDHPKVIVYESINK